MPKFNFTKLEGTKHPSILCFHGYGSNAQFIHKLKDQGVSQTLLSFDFPDQNLQEGNYAPEDLKYGTLAELLPAIYILKHCIVDLKITPLDFYGISGGAASLINVIGLLNTADILKEKEEVLQALQKGRVLLDVPFKSVEELIDFRGPDHELQVLAKSYQKNDMRPIDGVQKLKGLSLDITLFWQIPDEILSNRDDALFTERLKTANSKGKTTVLQANDGGHNTFHPTLWNYYNQL